MQTSATPVALTSSFTAGLKFGLFGFDAGTQFPVGADPGEDPGAGGFFGTDAGPFGLVPGVFPCIGLGSTQYAGEEHNITNNKLIVSKP